MKNKTNWFTHPLTMGVVVIATIVVAGQVLTRRSGISLPEINSPSPAIARNRTIEIGGVRRPVSDIRTRGTSASYERTKPKAEQYPYGKTPTVAPESNATTAATYAALTSSTGAPLSDKSPFAVGEKFDQASYEKSPDAYLEKFQPGRVWQSAQPGPGVPLIGRISSRNQSMKQGESVRLQVKTKPNAPVSYSSFDLGAFENKLPSITVAADEDGIAEAVFTATSGTIARVHIVAASPVATGRLPFEIYVEPND